MWSFQPARVILYIGEFWTFSKTKSQEYDVTYTYIIILEEAQTHAHLVIASTENYRGTIIPLHYSPFSPVSARWKKLRSSRSGCTEPTRRDRKSSSRRGILAGGQLTSHKNAPTGGPAYTPAHTHTHEGERDAYVGFYHTCHDPVNLNLRRALARWPGSAQIVRRNVFKRREKKGARICIRRWRETQCAACARTHKRGRARSRKSTSEEHEVMLIATRK